MKKPRILAVDDETSFLDILQQYFEPRGYEIDITPDGGVAIGLLSGKKYDVALLDLKMIGLNGDEVLGEIRRLGLETKVIFITAFSDSGKTGQRLLEEGAFAFIEKPVTSLKDLEALVNRASGTV
jgi:CheY-like chemotaxis protein